MAIQVFTLPALTDNYIYVLRGFSKTLVIDPGEAQPVYQFLNKKKWSLDFILNTHHHWDHTGGNLDLKKIWPKAQVAGFLKDAKRLPGIEIKLKENEVWMPDRFSCKVLSIPGHTLGHIAFYFTKDKKLFCGDTLFSMGCGRLFEGTASMLLASLKSLAKLPLETEIYAGHEYTLNNAKFALKINGNNKYLKERFKVISNKRKKGLPTVPFLLSEELKTNPFLRCRLLAKEGVTDQALLKWMNQRALSGKKTKESELFSKIRLLKDAF